MAEVKQSSETMDSFLKGPDYKSSGFAAITTVGPPPYVVADLQRGADGKMKVVYYDFQTKQPVNSIEGYTVLTSNAYFTPDGKLTEPPPGTPPPPEATTVKDILFKVGGGDSPRAQGREEPAGKGMARSQVGNFGYMNKPAGMGLLSALPGMPGLAAKAVNGVVNANNVAAVDAARQNMEVPGLTPGEKMKGTIRDRQGFVGRYGVNGQQYSVGLEAEDDKGRTTLTPNEARARGLAAGGLTEIDENQSLGQKVSGAVTKGANTLRSFLSNVFGSPVNQEAPNMATGVVSPSQENINKPGLIDRVNAPTPVERVSTPTVTNGAITPSPTVENTYNGISNLPSTPVSPVGIGTTPSYNKTQEQKTSLAADTNTGVGFTANYGPHRSAPPQQSLIDNVRESVGNVYGPLGKQVDVIGTSGTGEYGSARHRSPDRVHKDVPGVAMDFDVSVDGKKSTNEVAQQDVAMDFAARNPEAGVGYGPGYMTDENGLPGRMHLDTYGNPKAWGAANTYKNMDPNLKSNIDFARETGIGPTPTFGAPTPTPRPDPTGTSPETVDARQTSSLGFVGMPSNPSLSNQKISTSTPAMAASQGAIARSPAEISRIAQAIAGELDPSTMKGLQVGDPVATREFANVMASIENRAGSKRFGSLGKTLSPKQYNSLAPSKMAVTTGNYSQFGPALEQKVQDYYAGKITPTSYDITNYYNPDEASPKWGPKMEDAQQTGFHSFGTLPGYGPGQAFKDERAKMGYSAESTWGNRQDSPSESRRSSGSAVAKNASSNSASERGASIGSKTNKSDSSSRSSGGIGKSSHAAEHERDSSARSGSGGSRNSQNKNEKGSKESKSGGGIGRSTTGGDNKNSKSSKNEKSSKSEKNDHSSGGHKTA